MSGSSGGVVWVETTEEEVVITEEIDSHAVLPVETPIQRLLDSVGHEDNPEAHVFYCEECLILFQDQSVLANISGPSFILDFATSIGVPQRALLTLPYGLMIGRSSIPGAGVGVVNHGPTLSPGMHFGPYEGEVTARETASDLSWEIYKEKDVYEYIDAARESHSNWMRYVNCARNETETNLLAVQYKGSILFHCCRTIQPGDELMVWPSSKLLSNSSEAWAQVWSMKLKAAEINSADRSQVLVCSYCQLSFTTEAFLQRHTEHFHTQPQADCPTLASEPQNPPSSPPAAAADSAPVVLSVDPAKARVTCGDCGKVFKQTPHLTRHKLCVHNNKRPYCCPECRRSFSQASGLIRHQLTHKKQAVNEESDVHPEQSRVPSEQKKDSAHTSEHLDTAADPSIIEETREADPNENLQAPLGESEAESAGEAETTRSSCPKCNKLFLNEDSLKRHVANVHTRLRPYVCSVCRKRFGQFNDLTRHLESHRRRSGKVGEKVLDELEECTLAMPFSCAQCSLTFPSVETLQQHVSEHLSEQTTVEKQQADPEPDEEDPDVSPPPKTNHQRPQRLAARSRISAITKLIAPKRRAAVCKELPTSPALPVSDSTEPEIARNGKPTKHKWFSCNRCKRTYGNPDDLKVHECTPRQHKCGKCAATFKTPGFLRRHEQTAHVDAKSYSCDRCDKVFTTSGNLRQHKKTKTCVKYHCTSELFPCSYCQFSFTMKSYLIKHIKRHHAEAYPAFCNSQGLTHHQEEEEDQEEVEKEKECPHCGEICASKSLKSHPCFQQLKVLFLCTDCGKSFTNHYGLKQHQRIHTGEKPFACPHCTKSFSYSGQLNVHLRTHTGEKPYLCTHCGESFRQSGDLKRHERKHTGVRPFSCPECCKSFSRQQSLKAHQMLHLGQRMFKCAQCGKSFSRNYHLRRHLHKMHLLPLASVI